MADLAPVRRGSTAQARSEDSSPQPRRNVYYLPFADFDDVQADVSDMEAAVPVWLLPAMGGYGDTISVLIRSGRDRASSW